MLLVFFFPHTFSWWSHPNDVCRVHKPHIYLNKTQQGDETTSPAMFPSLPLTLTDTSHFYTVEETHHLFPMRLKTTFTWQLGDGKSLLGHQLCFGLCFPSFLACVSPLPILPLLSVKEIKQTTSPPFYFHTATASLTSHTIIILPIPSSPSIWPYFARSLSPWSVHLG